MGQMDFITKDAMIGGFALAAAPAQYGVTGLKTFIVSHGGIVYEKDWGRTRLNFSRAWIALMLTRAGILRKITGRRSQC